MDHNKMGKLEFCLDCQDDYGILNYNDGKKYIVFGGKRFLCNICKEKLENDVSEYAEKVDCSKGVDFQEGWITGKSEIVGEI